MLNLIMLRLHKGPLHEVLSLRMIIGLNHAVVEADFFLSLRPGVVYIFYFFYIIVYLVCDILEFDLELSKIDCLSHGL